MPGWHASSQKSGCGPFSHRPTCVFQTSATRGIAQLGRRRALRVTHDPVASGKSYSTGEIHIFRIRDGKVVEHWHQYHQLGMLRQLGAMPG